MSEIAPAGGGSNRLFVIIAVGLVGLLVLGLIAVGGIYLIPRIFQTASVSTPTVRVLTATRVLVAVASPQPTFTDTPLPTS
ncbi:MAG: hypothetical protein KGJ80_22065, partial [Chloroflexota bacterium]|nr:hypothetical protein [Chloroflexota bacterium]